uniref:Uncharacterized protein n=1 Tax=Glossina austeni TaxID=7395 RepID=A0A1A9UIQ6_GLOAU
MYAIKSSEILNNFVFIFILNIKSPVSVFGSNLMSACTQPPPATNIHYVFKLCWYVKNQQQQVQHQFLHYISILHQYCLYFIKVQTIRFEIDMFHITDDNENAEAHHT